MIYIYLCGYARVKQQLENKNHGQFETVFKCYTLKRDCWEKPMKIGLNRHLVAFR